MKYKKICRCCGKEFETNRSQKEFCDREHYLPCPVCGKLVLKKDRDFTRPPKCCSNECTHKLRQTKFKKRKCIFCGDEFIPKSGVQLVCDKLHTQKCEICGKEFERTPHNDGVVCSFECQLEKQKRTTKKHWGVEYPMQSPELRKRFHDAMEEKYGVRHALQYDKFLESAQNTNIEQFGTPYFCLTDKCRDNIKDSRTISKTNKRFQKDLEYYNIESTLEFRIENRWYDFKLDNSNTLIEIDPTYTHNSFGNHWEKHGLDKYYHRDKTQLAEDNGYRCIHVFDWDRWDNIINLIKPRETIYARKCQIYKLNLNVANKFIADNHIQGNCRGNKVAFGLVYDGELYQVMSFGVPRYNKNYDIELLRLCTKIGYEVVGGASKLFKFATQNYGMYNIISYCDRAKFNGKVYENMGMTLSHITPPQEIWSREGEHITANLLRQRGYDQLFNAEYGKGASNEYLMLLNGWLPIYDCGQKVFVYK